MSFSDILGSNASVGSIIARFKSGDVHVICPPEAPGIDQNIARNKADGSSAESLNASANLSLKVLSFFSAQAAFSTVSSVNIKLAGGNIESGTEAQILVKFENLSQGSKDAITNEEKANHARFFELVTQLYRGDVTVTVNHKTGTSAELQAHVNTAIAATLNGSVNTNDQSTLTVTGGVWLLSTVNYFVPGSH